MLARTVELVRRIFNENVLWDSRRIENISYLFNKIICEINSIRLHLFFREKENE